MSHWAWRERVHLPGPPLGGTTQDAFHPYQPCQGVAWCACGQHSAPPSAPPALLSDCAAAAALPLRPGRWARSISRSRQLTCVCRVLPLGGCLKAAPATTTRRKLSAAPTRAQQPQQPQQPQQLQQLQRVPLSSARGGRQSEPLLGATGD